MSRRRVGAGVSGFTIKSLRDAASGDGDGSADHNGMLAALAGLAAHWPYHLEAGKVLSMAARSRDPEVRKAGAMAAREAGVDVAASPRVIL